MKKKAFSSALAALQEQYALLDWTYHDIKANGHNEKVYDWPGEPDEDILICVHKSNGSQELFHRHDYFYFNYTYKGQYDTLSYKYDRRITIQERELYAGQPFAGHALCVHDNHETVIIGVLIRRETFLRSFLPIFSANTRLFRFFLDPSTNHFSDEYIHFKVEDDGAVRRILEMMVVERANKRPDTQDVLKPLALAYLMEISRQYTSDRPQPAPEIVSERIIRYMSEHVETANLKNVAARFSYHPNYISALMRKELGKSFSGTLLQMRMDRAMILLKGSDLSVEQIAMMLGYANSSNFYKAFKSRYGTSPREYVPR